MKRRIQLALLALISCCVFFLPAKQAQQSSHSTKKIDDAALRNADAKKADWLTHGRNYAETRFSPLQQIDAGNVKTLGLAWAFDAETTRGLEATPIVVDGVIYTTGSWSIVYALEARTG